MFNKIIRNAKVIVKVTAYGVAATAAYALETAGTIAAIGKICEGCDENNPANFWQLAGSLAVGAVGTAAGAATTIVGMDKIVDEIEENWR